MQNHGTSAMVFRSTRIPIGILVLLGIKFILTALLCITGKAFVILKLIPKCRVCFLMFLGRYVILGCHQLLYGRRGQGWKGGTFCHFVLYWFLKAY